MAMLREVVDDEASDRAKATRSRTYAAEPHAARCFGISKATPVIVEKSSGQAVSAPAKARGESKSTSVVRRGTVLNKLRTPGGRERVCDGEIVRLCDWERDMERVSVEERDLVGDGVLSCDAERVAVIEWLCVFVSVIDADAVGDGVFVSLRV